MTNEKFLNNTYYVNLKLALLLLNMLKEVFYTTQIQLSKYL